MKYPPIPMIQANAAILANIEIICIFSAIFLNEYIFDTVRRTVNSACFSDWNGGNNQGLSSLSQLMQVAGKDSQ